MGPTSQHSAQQKEQVLETRRVIPQEAHIPICYLVASAK